MQNCGMVVKHVGRGDVGDWCAAFGPHGRLAVSATFPTRGM